MHQKDKIVIWPAYFDRTKSRGEGRRVPKRWAVLSPKLPEIKKIAEKLGLEYEVVPNASYPKTPWLKTGMLLVSKESPKQTMIKRIGKRISKSRKDTAKN